jgi:hypothetical protein
MSCLFVSTAVGQKFNHNSYIGKEPPEIVSRKEHWLGGREQITLNDLKGRMVWLQFNF